MGRAGSLVLVVLGAALVVGGTSGLLYDDTSYVHHVDRPGESKNLSAEPEGLFYEYGELSPEARRAFLGALRAYEEDPDRWSTYTVDRRAERPPEFSYHWEGSIYYVEYRGEYYELYTVTDDGGADWIGRVLVGLAGLLPGLVSLSWGVYRADRPLALAALAGTAVPVVALLYRTRWPGVHHFGTAAGIGFAVSVLVGGLVRATLRRRYRPRPPDE